MPDVQVEVWDAPGERCGWRTLGRRLAEPSIQVLGVGEETVSAGEALRAAGLVKALHPGCLVVAGGTYFAHALEATLADGRVDVIVRGEGEATFVELLQCVRERRPWNQVKGLAFRGSDGSVTLTPPRALIDDLDSLPFPTYDLVDMGLYGRGSRNHPGLVSIEHSRGCTDSCGFCILWKHMGQPAGTNGQVRPRWRSKSGQRSFQEVLRLYRHFGRRTFGWVDPTFNAAPGWSDDWSEAMLKSELVDARGRARTVHTAWLRADGVLRDQRLGILEKLVRAGLRQVMIGVERDDPAGLAELNKHHNSADVCREAFAIFRERYPQVYTIGTMIYGLPGDRADDLKRLADLEYRMGMDYGFVMPLTPNPGTAVAEQAARRSFIVNPDLESHNFHTPVCRTETLSLRDLESVYWRMMLHPSLRHLGRWVRKSLLETDARKRRVHRALFARGTAIATRSLLRAILHPKDSRPALYSRKPSWYDR
jgi:radical SAM superfamily enzyme YgiQ (UPF0313 family)